MAWNTFVGRVAESKGDDRSNRRRVFSLFIGESTSDKKGDAALHAAFDSSYLSGVLPLSLSMSDHDRFVILVGVFS
jgi:hypothetical protein